MTKKQPTIQLIDNNNDKEKEQEETM